MVTSNINYLEGNLEREVRDLDSKNFISLRETLENGTSSMLLDW